MIEGEIVRLGVNCIQGLNRNLQHLFTLFHHLVNSATNVINYCTPFTRNNKTLNTVKFISSFESVTRNFHSLANVHTSGMFGIYDCPRIFL
jgi:hypothetical protein